MKDASLLIKKIICIYRKQVKFFLLSIIIGISVHAVKFLNYLPTWDSIRMIDKGGEYTMVEYGRWFAYIATSVLSAPYDLQWVSGIVSVIFLSATIILLLEIFEIKNNWYKTAAICLFMVFPSITAAFCYMTWTAAYSFSIFLAFVALYIVICDDTKTGLFFAAVSICLSMGIYQIYVTTITVGFVYYLIFIILSNEYKKLFFKVKRFVVSLLSGCLGYYIINKIVLKMLSITLDSYQGIDSVGKMGVKDLFLSLKNLFYTAGHFYMGTNKFNIYGAINIVILILFAIFIISILYAKDYNFKEKCSLIVLFVIAQLISYAFLFVSKGAFYHMLMQIGNYFTYLFVIFICDNDKMYLFKNKIIRKITVIVIFILCFYHFLNANIAYKQMEMSYQRTSFEIQEVLMQIDRISVDGSEKVALFGLFSREDDLINPIPAITGASTSNFVGRDVHFRNFAKYYFGRNFELASEDEKKYIEKKDVYKEMDCYPYGNYVKKIDNFIVVKFENYSN